MSQLRCGCVYADSNNTPSVRQGFEMGGYLKTPCAQHATMSTTTPGQPTDAEREVKDLMLMIDAFAFGYPFKNKPGVRRDEVQARVRALLATKASASDADLLARVLRCRYPVSTDLNPKGWGWDTGRLDEVVADLQSESVQAQQAPLQGYGDAREIELIEKAALRVGMKSFLNHGAASCVYTEGIDGVSQGHLVAFTREVALHCVAALSPSQTTPSKPGEAA